MPLVGFAVTRPFLGIDVGEKNRRRQQNKKSDDARSAKVFVVFHSDRAQTISLPPRAIFFASFAVKGS